MASHRSSSSTPWSPATRLASIANRFGITIDVLVAYNEWPEGISHPIYPNDEIRIPPDSKIPSAADELTRTTTDDTSDSDDTESTDADTESTDAPPSGSGEDCETGEYTIEAGDTTRVKVAEKFDVTVEALDAANAGTAGYSSFYPGLKIVIPCWPEPDAAHAPQPLPITCGKPSPSNSNTVTPAPS